MPVPQMLNVYRHDRKNQALITLAGEIDLDSAPLVSESLEACLRDGIRTIDVDLTTVTFCDCSGLNAFLDASRHIVAAGGTLRLHHPRPMLARLFALTGTGSLLLGLPVGQVPPPRPGDRVGGIPAPQLPPWYEAIPWLAPIVAAVSGGAR